MNSLIIENYVPDAIVNNIEEKIKQLLNKCGIYYRIFCRRKTSASIVEKIARKGYTLGAEKLMQDVIGIRVVLYFSDDIDICKQILLQSFTQDNISETRLKEDVFSPERLNIVFKLPENDLFYIEPSLWEKYPIDKTFEIQIRTMFSEGWHEIEHDVRFKSKTDWKQYKDLSRSLNGIFATLETCDWAILQLMDALTYQEYKNKHWESMLKNKLRIRVRDSQINPQIIQVMDSNPEIAKALYRADRGALIHYLAIENKYNIPLTIDNLVFILNEKWLHFPEISILTSEVFRTLLS